MSPRIICMEHNNVEVMKKDHYVAQKVHHSNFYRCKVVMKNKCEKYNISFIEVDQFYPSSQLCSRCGYRQNIGPKKIYICPNCGLEIDRDDNAAKNLQQYALDLNFRF